MDLHSSARSIGNALDERHRAIVDREFPRALGGVTYLNAGSAGRKPGCVLDAISQGWQHLNINPTRTTFLEEEWITSARNLAARVFSVDTGGLLLTNNTTQGLQLIMQSFLKNPGDELITTDHEHGSVKTVIRHLEETRGIVTRMHSVDADVSSDQFCLNILSSVSERTRLVLLSEIDCFTGWKPDLNTIVESLALLDVPLLVDGAHSPGHVIARPGAYPMWVGSGHKWLGGPNATGFVYVTQDLIPRLEPVWLGDYFFNKKDDDIYDITRFECGGTTDVVRWKGLSAALELHLQLDAHAVLSYQRSLVRYLRNQLAENFNVAFRTPPFSEHPGEEHAGLLTFYFPEPNLLTGDLRQSLWNDHKIWVQPDFLNKTPGHGARVSCHYSLQEEDLDMFVKTLRQYVR